jgi:hypothetical protein
MYLFSRNFWIYSFERIVKTGIVTLVAIMAADQFVPTSGDQWARAALQIGVACRQILPPKRSPRFHCSQ